MTVTYTAEVATCRKVGCFLTVLLRWRGSIYKLVWMDLAVFLTIYYILCFIYRFLLNADQQKTFEQVAFYFQSYLNMVPVAFVLGFFVSIVMTRWWEQYMMIPWPDPIAVYVSAHIHGQDDRARLMRRTIMRYACLTQAIVFSMIAPKVKKRFPTLQSFVDVGLLQENEKNVFEAMDESFPKVSKYWMPIIWAASIVSRARKEGRIRDDFAVKTLVDELNKFRGQCGGLLIYDWIPIPLVYTQVVTVAVYSFFLGAVLGMQWTYTSATHEENAKTVNYYIPIFTLLQFFFYMGWLKVAESLINPFGEDDDDFEVNWMIDRNLQVSYLIVDEMHQDHPDLVKDQYWDEVFPTELPYDGDSKREEQPEASTAKFTEKGRLQFPYIVVDRPSDQSNQQKERERARDELTKRIKPQPSSTSTGKFSGDYKSARASILTLESEDDASTPRQKPDEPQTQRVKILSGIYEPSDSDDFEATPKDGAKTEAQQPDEGSKDDFTRLKEQRDRLRAARQKLRFVQQIGDLANVSVRQDPRVVELTGESSEEDEEEEDLEEEFDDNKTNSTK